MTGRKAPAWQPDEVALAGSEHLDPDYVAGFDRKSAFDPGPDIEILKGLGLGAESTVVDLGSGTGDFAIAASRLCRRVVAADVSPAMLAVTQSKLDAGHITNVEVVQAGFLTYEHQKPPADFVFTKNALHHLPDFWKGAALDRIASMVGPGGVLRLRDLVYSFAPSERTRAIESWLAGAPAKAEDGWTREELETHVREEFSTYSWLLEDLLRRAGFEILAAEYADSRVFAAYTCVRR